MVPIPWQIGALGAALAAFVGLVLGLSFGVVLSAALRRRRRYLLDGIAGGVGFLGASWLSAASGKFAIELNGAVVGWQPGTPWPGLRAWAFEHAFLAAIIGCLICVALTSVAAAVADHLREPRDRQPPLHVP
jgi:ABC-type dipeptide/oligopeptide/nickel transport system permease component